MQVIQGEGRKPWRDWTEFFTAEPTDHLTKPRDGHGHSEWLRLRIHPSLNGHLHAMVRSQRFPMYDSAAAFVRDAIIRQMHWLAQEQGDPDLAKAAKVFTVQARRDQRRADAKRFSGLLDDIEQELEESRRDGNAKRRREALQDLMEILSALPEDFRDRARDLVRRYK